MAAGISGRNGIQERGHLQRENNTGTVSAGRSSFLVHAAFNDRGAQRGRDCDREAGVDGRNGTSNEEHPEVCRAREPVRRGWHAGSLRDVVESGRWRRQIRVRPGWREGRR